MECFKIENLSFTYPNAKNPALVNISMQINNGEFVTLCGKSGCGKTTFLRLLKSSLAPFGNLSGNIFFAGVSIDKVGLKKQAAEIGFVMQNPDNQIVTDKVWHELAFGLESLGFSTPDIRARVSEISSFFGINEWFHKKVNELSGGQKQILNLAAVMAMQPSVLLLDEPTSQLDPIAAQEFLRTLEKINRELGTTVILTEHRLEEAFAISDRVIVMDEGKIIADSAPANIGHLLRNHDISYAFPAPMRIYGAVENGSECPVTVREGRLWLENFAQNNSIKTDIDFEDNHDISDNPVVEVKNAYFRYDKEEADVIKGLNLKVNKGEIFTVVGGNGSGKTTMMSLLSGLNKPYRGNVLINGKKHSAIKNIYSGVLGVLPQNPQTLFVKKSVYLELEDMLTDIKTTDEKNRKISEVVKLCRIGHILENHPYDLSGGEQQRVALAKILLLNPQILLFDEPTKGMDAHFKNIFTDVLKSLGNNGATVIIVSHDIEFCAGVSDRCAMFFDGNITSCGKPREFFSGKNFYTTSANKMARNFISGAVLAEDVIIACGGNVPEKHNDNSGMTDIQITAKDTFETKKRPKIFVGCLFVLLFIAGGLYSVNAEGITRYIAQFAAFSGIVVSLGCFFPQRNIGYDEAVFSKGKLSKRTLASLLLVLVTIPLTVLFGVYFFDNRKYFFISMLVILQTMLPFAVIFEKRKPQARELIIISVLCGIAVAGRSAFFMLPQFKPAAAVIIISGVCFGGETGFLVGAMTVLVSNFFFGHGPWTPWQMIAFGMIGFLAGILFKKGLLKKNRMSLCVFGAVATFLVYGGIMNPASVLTWQMYPTSEMILASYITGIPFDVVHSFSTAVFLWFISEPMIEKIDRVKVKYGLITNYQR